MNPAEFCNIADAEKSFWWYRGMRRILYSILDPVVSHRPIRTVLEAGCGTGYNAVALQERYGWDVYALDLAMEGLRYGRSLGAARLIQGDITALPLRPQSVDAVVSLDVIVHLPRGAEGRAIGEFARVLRPGGLLVLRVSALDMLRSRHSQFACERQRFTSARLRAAVARYGLQVLRCTYANTLLFPIALAKFRVYEPLLRRPPSSGVQPIAQWLNQALALPLAAESTLLASGVNLPVGQSVVLIGNKAA
jgi:SAM-dependent methyltransferase